MKIYVLLIEISKEIQGVKRLGTDKLTIEDIKYLSVEDVIQTGSKYVQIV